MGSSVISRSHAVRRTGVEAADPQDEEMEDSDSDDEEEEVETVKPHLFYRQVAHHGGINRIRSMQQHPNIVATWGESGHVQV